MTTGTKVIVFEDLRKPFCPSDVSWRIGQSGKNGRGEIWCKIVCYVDNRAIQNRLDEVCGAENWRNEYRAGPSGGVVCGLSIKCGDEWVTKWDGAENTDIEGVKGGLSDSMKRAAVQWGIARNLYDIGETWADIHVERTVNARYAHVNMKKKGAAQDDWVDFWWSVPRKALDELGGRENPDFQTARDCLDSCPPDKLESTWARVQELNSQGAWSDHEYQHLANAYRKRTQSSSGHPNSNGNGRRPAPASK